MRGLRGAAGTLVGLFCFVACGSDDGTPGSPSGNPPADAGAGVVATACGTTDAHVEACGMLAKTYCTKLFSCDENLAVQGQWDQGLCELVQDRNCLRLTKQFAIDATATSTATTRIDGLSCGEFLVALSGYLPFAGVASEGEPCNFKTACLGDKVLCSAQTQGETGTCQVPTSVPCKPVDGVFTCPSGMICNVQTIQCVVVSSGPPPKEPGATCQAGELCAGSYECTAGTCKAGTPVEKRPNPGAPCGGAQNYLCGLGLACVGGDDADQPGSCENAGELDQACPTNLNPKMQSPPCVGGLECTGGTCALPACKP